MASAREERHREQEFYRYYHPLLRRSGGAAPSEVDLSKPDHSYVPRSSPDTALNAFCQLGALRLGARRSMILLFSSQHTYILAEATRTLSLRDDTVHDDDDELWIGYAILPRGFSPCERTVADYDPKADHTRANAGMVHVINDLREDPQQCTQPYMTGDPRVKFYAGVPLISQKGLPIGTYCILDDTPRQGLLDKEISFLCQMSTTVMEHFEILRASMEFGQGSQMLTCIDNFFQATDPSVFPDFDQEVYEGDDNDCITGPGNPSASASAKPQEDNSQAPPKAVPRSALTSNTGIDLELQHTFRTAAQLVRDASDADGVLFLGPTTQKNSKNASSPQGQSPDGRTDCSVNTDLTSTGGETSTDSESNTPHKDSKCTILGYSMRGGNNTALKPLSSRTLKALLHRYPKGKIWVFNAAGEASSDSHDSNSDTQIKAPQPAADSDHRKPAARASRASQLQVWLPGVRSLCLVTLYDPVRESAYAGCFVWSNEPSRVFSPQGELSYVRAFCEVVSSNISRLEARKMDEVKTQFISSVSHELRSPLHGIIGSIDLIQEQEVFDWSLILQIEKCSTSLMDVIDHLLDFAKINNLVKEKAAAKPGSKARRRQTEYSKPLEGGQLKVHSLSQTTAEIVDVIYYAHCHTANAQQRERVEFILDVSTDLAMDYTIPVGSWKRICMNIVSNALKYTTDGYILVTLKIMQGARKTPTAVFTVKDTGCGMSREFLENRLFRAFTQEQPLSAGTGLGMSLVAKLIKGLEGKIDVNSAKDVGTTFKVTVPLDVQTRYVSATATVIPLQGLRVRVLESSTPLAADTEKVPRQLHLTSLHKTLRHLGAVVVDDDTDLDFIWEADLMHYSQSPNPPTGLASRVIVLCDSFMSAAHLRKVNNSTQWMQSIEFLARPYGPDRILAGVTKCREQERHDSAMDSPDSSGTAMKSDVPSMHMNGDSLEATQNNNNEALLAPAANKPTEVPESSRRGAQMRLQELASDKPLPQSGEEKSGEESQSQSPSEDREVASLSLASPDFAQAQSDANGSGTEDDSAKRKLCLFLIDDNKLNLRLLTTYADRNNHPWLSASDGAEAVELYKSSAKGGNTYNKQDNIMPAVVFMDINMPVMDGYEATRQIREFEKAEGLRRATIVALTGLGSDDARERAKRSGVDVFLTKPVRPRELKKLLGEIEEARSKEEAEQSTEHVGLMNGTQNLTARKI